MTPRCVPKPDPKSVTLPILADTPSPTAPKIRPSKSGKWRLLSLVLVHALVALHVALWMRTGKTLSPLEPSESMQFSKEGLVNAGLIFFALLIGSTLVLGRWFCGWACHMVALQDGCRWILHKIGIRPRAVNLGVLAVVPWLAFAYMFLEPIAGRLLAGEGLATSGVNLYTDAFWRTFPSWPVALATLVVCGFAIIYVLGSKGFCTYGCPYGAIFGVADQLAPVRIRVTDACEGCGHCTAVCTSNVKVHQEVRDFGMVVDPGCMKCLDCVSVCPNDALYVGFGAPAILATRRPSAKPASAHPYGAWSRNALLLAFIVATLAVFDAYEGELGAYVNGVHASLLGLLSALSFAVALVFRGKAQRASEYTLGEEALLALFFLLALLGFRGLHGTVPFLFSLGLSAMLAWTAVQLLRTAFVRELRWQRFVLKSEGRLRAAGVVFVLLGTVVLAGWALAGAEQRKLAVSRAVFADGVFAANANRVEESIADFRRALDVDPSFVDARRNLAKVFLLARRLPESIVEFQRVLALNASDVTAHMGLAEALCRTDRLSEGIAEYERVIELAPDNPDAHAMLATAFMASQAEERALPHVREAVRLAPGRPEFHYFLADVLEKLGKPADAKLERERAVAIPPPQRH